MSSGRTEEDGSGQRRLSHHLYELTPILFVWFVLSFSGELNCPLSAGRQVTAWKEWKIKNRRPPRTATHEMPICFFHVSLPSQQMYYGSSNLTSSSLAQMVWQLEPKVYVMDLKSGLLLKDNSVNFPFSRLEVVHNTLDQTNSHWFLQI